MNKKFTFSLAILAALSMAACADQPTDLQQQAPAFSNGIGGQDYLLNIIGVSKDKKAEMDNNSGHRIFVQLWGGQSRDDIEGTDFAALDKVNKIFLTPNTTGDFAVLDANATDNDGAEFTMPVSVSGNYTVYARALGKPGGWAKVATCATEVVYDDFGVALYDQVICSTGSYVYTAVRNSGKPVVENVTQELLFLNVTAAQMEDETLACVDAKYNAGGDGVFAVPLFDSCFENYFWNYDNHGLKVLQLRFYAAS